MNLALFILGQIGSKRIGSARDGPDLWRSRQNKNRFLSEGANALEVVVRKVQRLLPRLSFSVALAAILEGIPTLDRYKDTPLASRKEDDEVKTRAHEALWNNLLGSINFLNKKTSYEVGYTSSQAILTALCAGPSGKDLPTSFLVTISSKTTRGFNTHGRFS